MPTKQQAFNEALLKLMLLMYRIDNKITLTEQDYFDRVKASLTWTSTINIDSFINHASGLVNQYINQGRSKELLKELREALNFDPDQALSLARTMVQADSEATDCELDIIAYLEEKLVYKQAS